MIFYRHIESNLETWKAGKERKPLVLRGARQVGKTTLINEFGKSYRQYGYLNLEKRAHRDLFEIHDEVKQLVDAIFLNLNLSSDWENTLLFIDEIQESPKAIQILRYFYEELPELHVIAAGSLLEFAFEKIRSFPVGRIEYLYLSPLNFQEYLKAVEQDRILTELHQIPVRDIAHNVLLKHFHDYALIGGMPEIVRTWSRYHSLIELPSKYESIWATYIEDVEKYANSDTERKVIKHVIRSAPNYLDQRVKFQNFGQSNFRSREVGEAMRSLEDAKIIQLIYPVTQLDLPIRPDIRKSPRLQFLDTGLINHVHRLHPQLISIEDLADAYKGALAPHLITQEIISLNTNTYQKPNFWVREKRQSDAEVDLVFPFRDKVIPIEIKSGSTGSLRSLHQFVERSPHPFAIRLYAGKFKIEKQRTPGGTPYLLMNMPYYLGTKIPEYIDYFTSHYQL